MLKEHLGINMQTTLSLSLDPFLCSSDPWAPYALFIFPNFRIALSAAPTAT
jgi:hypothetical protein